MPQAQSQPLTFHQLVAIVDDHTFLHPDDEVPNVTIRNPADVGSLICAMRPELSGYRFAGGHFVFGSDTLAEGEIDNVIWPHGLYQVRRWIDLPNAWNAYVYPDGFVRINHARMGYAIARLLIAAHDAERIIAHGDHEDGLRILEPYLCDVTGEHGSRLVTSTDLHEPSLQWSAADKKDFTALAAALVNGNTTYMLGTGSNETDVITVNIECATPVTPARCSSLSGQPLFLAFLNAAVAKIGPTGHRVRVHGPELDTLSYRERETTVKIKRKQLNARERIAAMGLLTDWSKRLDIPLPPQPSDQ